MDPNATLAEIRQILTAITRAPGPVVAREAQLGSQLAERVNELDDWISRGGALPDAWAKGSQ